MRCSWQLLGLTGWVLIVQQICKFTIVIFDGRSKGKDAIFQSNLNSKIALYQMRIWNTNGQANPTDIF